MAANGVNGSVALQAYFWQQASFQAAKEEEEEEGRG
jgi:hypothetical protein